MKKERKIKGHYTLVDTYNATDNYREEDYKWWCDGNGEDYEEKTDYDYHRWAEDEAQRELEDFFTNLKYSHLYGRAVMVEGSLGLWWGHPDIEPKFFENPIKAIQSCIDGAWDVIIKKVGHRLEVVNLHHDGRNYFTITFLTPLGEGRYLDHGKVSTKNMENVLKLPEYLF